MRYPYTITTYTDENYDYRVFFNPSTGLRVRTGIINEYGEDTGIDPFRASYPELMDIGIMERCVCAKQCNVDCYQKAIARTGNNMSLSDFTWLIEQSKGKTLQVALGGAGDPDTHEQFEEILKVCAKNNIVPNFTTSGIALTPEKARLAHTYCGAVAISEHNAPYTEKAIKMLLENEVKTNVHYVLNRDTIEQATEILVSDTFPRYKGINALVFLLYKPIGLGKKELVLQPDDPKLARFFEAFDQHRVPFKIGFDSCTSAGLVNFAKSFNPVFVDYCEGARFSMYVSADLKAMACSFANQDPTRHIQLDPQKGIGIKQAWESEEFNSFRHQLSSRCPNCKNRLQCGGGCPIINSITLCTRVDKTE